MFVIRELGSGVYVIEECCVSYLSISLVVFAYMVLKGWASKWLYLCTILTIKNIILLPGMFFFFFPLRMMDILSIIM